MKKIIFLNIFLFSLQVFMVILNYHEGSFKCAIFSSFAGGFTFMITLKTILDYRHWKQLEKAIRLAMAEMMDKQNTTADRPKPHLVEN